MVLAGIISVPSSVGVNKKEASLHIGSVLLNIVPVGLTVTVNWNTNPTQPGWDVGVML